MKAIELTILTELMKNSRVSDRELAKRVGRSQPTVTRIRHKLEQNGMIKEYTLIPNFTKLGLEIMALSFSRFASGLNKREVEKVKNMYREKTEEERTRGKAAKLRIIMQEKGQGLGYDGVTISFHENYQSFVEFIKLARQNPHVELKNGVKPFPVLEIDRIDSFLINLSDDFYHYCPLTFKALAEHLLTLRHK
jgi:DNA-binding Lrp family transcriptional regulator